MTVRYYERRPPKHYGTTTTTCFPSLFFFADKRFQNNGDHSRSKPPTNSLCRQAARYLLFTAIWTGGVGHGTRKQAVIKMSSTASTEIKFLPDNDGIIGLVLFSEIESSWNGLSVMVLQIHAGSWPFILVIFAQSRWKLNLTARSRKKSPRCHTVRQLCLSLCIDIDS